MLWSLLAFTLQNLISLFIQITSQHCSIVLVHVDDILVIGSNSEIIQTLRTQLNYRIALKDLHEIDYFLGIQVKHIVDGIHLSQTKCIIDLMHKAKM